MIFRKTKSTALILVSTIEPYTAIVPASKSVVYKELLDNLIILRSPPVSSFFFLKRKETDKYLAQCFHYPNSAIHLPLIYAIIKKKFKMSRSTTLMKNAFPFG